MSELPHDGLVIRNIAIATDFSPWSERATQHALVVAHRFGAVLHFLHAVRRSEFSLVPGMMVQLDELAERDCDQMIARLNGGHCLDNIEYHCWQMDGEVSEGFGDFVREHNIDLLIVGTRGRSGISKLLLGSVAEEIFHCVCCPVLTIGPWSRPAARQLKLNRVLFATDLSAESFSAISYVLTAAKTWQADIDVLHVCSAATSEVPRFNGKFQPHDGFFHQRRTRSLRPLSHAAGGAFGHRSEFRPAEQRRSDCPWSGPSSFPI